MKDLISCVSHLIGAIASIVGLVFLIVWACLYGNVWHIVSFSIYGASMILLYTASTIYHWVKGEKASATLRILDHIMIYVLIAGTYTPICLGPLRGGWGWSIFGIVWGLTLLRNLLQNILDECTKMAIHVNISCNGMGSYSSCISYD